MEDNLVNGTVDYWGAEAQSPKQELYPLTPEEEDALWADPVYGPRSGGDEDWEADQPTGAKSRSSDSFTLKYMDEEKTVSREEVVTLAQKGMDYDRVRRRLEETGSALKEYEQIRGQLGLRGEQLRWMDELAKEQGLSLDTILEETHAKLLSGKTGKSLEESKAAALRQREDWHKHDAARRQRAEDINAFYQAYPEQAADPQKIPQSVWEKVRQGDSLLNAYRNHEVEELRKEVARQKQLLEKQQQQQRTTGSQFTRGSKWVDPFDAIWYNGE